MFDNIGKKIMNLAKVVCWVGIILSFGAFLAMLLVGAIEEEWLILGLSFAVLVVGCFGSWIGSFFTYGFGKLIENTEILVNERKDTDINDKLNKVDNKDHEKIVKKEQDNSNGFSFKRKIMDTHDVENKKVSHEPGKAKIGAKTLPVSDLFFNDYLRYHYPEDLNYGILITKVNDDSVAYGILLSNDIILEFNGVVLVKTWQLIEELNKIDEGSNTVADLKVLRAGKEIAVQLKW